MAEFFCVGKPLLPITDAYYLRALPTCATLIRMDNSITKTTVRIGPFDPNGSSLPPVSQIIDVSVASPEEAQRFHEASIVACQTVSASASVASVLRALAEE